MDLVELALQGHRMAVARQFANAQKAASASFKRTTGFFQEVGRESVLSACETFSVSLRLLREAFQQCVSCALAADTRQNGKRGKGVRAVRGSVLSAAQ